ncbi:sugar phosphate isomerase/epimerase family protein [Oceanobacillus picturae]|uniref:sugar phosphate isomerase/epimerase family protein n=1 Tax=Oceanobacillus picturae TaxID=171693 RepID=UPI000E69FBFC|nr:sugar phosphate isomerase/epimerase [Oceanobacillus picturae]RIU94864.1 sugar phosphate isomerase/epimerase [Oceanobacillus picturae]
MGKIGLQLYTVRDSAEANFQKLLTDVGELGYEGVQFAGFYDASAEDVKKTLHEATLRPAGAHVPIDQLQNNLQEVMRYHEAIENQLIICPYLPDSMRENKAGYLQTAELFNQIGKELKEAGFQFGYHNHAFEFDRIEETTGFEVLFENTDPDLVKMELDCFWATYAGHDPNKIIRDYKSRCISLHLKDIKVENGEKISTEIGTGTLDMNKLIQSGLDHNVEWFIVEQEHFTGDPLDSAKKNVEALKKMI